MFSHSRRLIKGMWGRRWFRRITYMLVSGAAIGSAVVWTLRQPFLKDWLIEKLAVLVREETGLGLEVRDLEVHVIQGRLILRDFTLGGDLLRADRLEVQVDFATLLGRNPHIWNIELENPRSVIDAQRLAKIRLKPREDTGSTSLVRLDRLTVTGGRLRIQEPAWQVPGAEFTYRISGKGIGPNRLATEIHVPWFAWWTGTETLNGSMKVKANLSDLALEIKTGEVKLGRNEIFAHGSYAFKERMVASNVTGKADLAQVMHLLDPKAPRIWDGIAEFTFEARGAIVDPAWSIAARGTGVSARSLNLQPGDADLKADGSTHHLNLQALAWTSSQGKLTASGQWKQGTGSQLIFQCEQLSLAPFVPLSRVNFLKELSVDVSGQAQLPGDPWKRFLWDQATLTVEGRFARAGTDVGQFRLAAADAVVTLNEVRLDVPEAQAEGQGTLQIGPRGDLRSIRAEASIRTDASLVADVLQAWDIGEGDENGKAIKLGMSGMADAQGAMEWSPETGMVLHGHVEVEEPRWHGATLDQLRADVAIEDDELRVDNIEGKKNDGEAHGALWLTWRDVAADQDEIDMRFEASGLSVEEGLRAGDVGDLPITGTGSGWARIHGRYDRIWIEGGGAVEGADVYGVKIPYASGDMVYDITGDQLSIKNVRVAEKAGALGTPEGEPTGLLALQGGMDMDLREETWQLWAKGNLDSQPLGLPGPRFQAQVDAQFNGPWTGSYGPFDLPLGTFVFQGGRLFLGQESLEGLEGKLDTGVNVLKMQVGQAGKDLPMVNLEAGPKGQALAGNLAVHIGADSADTAQLARRFTNGLLKNAGLDLKVEGSWDGSGLRWQGHLDHLAAHFEGFDLIQTEPTRLQGDETSLTLDVKMQGIGTTSTERAAWMHLAGRLPFSGTSPMDAKLRGTTDLAHLKDIIDHVLEVDEFSLMDDLKPEGTADFDLAFGGTFLEPKVDGLLSIKDGRTQIRTYPQSVEDLAFNLHFKGQDIILLESDPLRGRLAQGDLQAWGVISWEFGGITAYDLQTKLKNFQMRDIPVGFELYGDLDAVLQGTKEEGGILSGTLQGRRMLYQAEINLRDLILASATGGVPVLAASDPNDPLTRIDLDLDLVLHQPWEFDTNLLKVQGRPQGAFKIQGTLAEPGLKGKMNIVPGGRLTNLLPAGDVVLEYGTIEWTSPQVLYPNLDLQGRVDIPPYVVNLSIRGSMDGLEMKQTSTPALRQDEITAILIDPSLASEIGSFSGPGSQTSMNYGFANTGSGLVTTLALASFQESVRRTFGLDRVSVAWRTGSGTGTSETSVTVGKSANVFGYTIPLVLTHQQTGETTSTSGQVEWRFGNLVLLLGVSQSGANEAAPSGEIRHSWSPGW